MREKIKVMIVEDHPIFGFGLRRLVDVEPDFEIIAEIRDGKEAVEQALRLRPDVILMDINLPTMDGLEATKKIKRELASTGVIVLTAFHFDEEQMVHALNAGASAYFPKDVGLEELIPAIHAVAEGKYVIDGKVTGKAQTERWLKLKTERECLACPTEWADELTPQELEILKLVVRGYTRNKDIARKLGVSTRTVSRRLRSIYRKTGVKNRTGAVLTALRHGLIGLSGCGDGM